jgi:hypothetical protein
MTDKKAETKAAARWLKADEYKEELKRKAVLCGHVAQRGPFKNMVCGSPAVVNKDSQSERVDWRCSVCMANISTIRKQSPLWVFELTEAELPKSIEMKHLFNDDCYEYSYGSFPLNGRKCYIFTERWILTGYPEHLPVKRTVDEWVASFIKGGKYYHGIKELECDIEDLDYALKVAGLPSSDQLNAYSICLKAL